MTEGAVNLTRKDELSLDAAHLYYGGMTQAEVAGRLHVSRPTVSKLLAHAERRGFVHIEVLDPREHDEHLIASLQERYALDELRLVSPPRPTTGNLAPLLGAQAALLLGALVRDCDRIAVTDSPVVTDVVRCLDTMPLHGVEVIRMSRGLVEHAPQRSGGGRSGASVHRLAIALRAHVHSLDAPLVVESVPRANQLRSRPDVRRGLDLARTARIVLFSVEGPRALLDMMVDRLGLSRADQRVLRERAVGEICSRVVDAEGCVCLPDLNNRTLGLSLTELRHIEQKVLVAGGVICAPVIRAALESGYANRLVTDVGTARWLVEASA